MAKGRRDREAMIRRFGFIPMSVISLKRGELHRSLYHYATERPGASMQASDSVHRVDTARSASAAANAAERRDRGMIGGSLKSNGANAAQSSLSIMAAELVEFFMRYYTRPGGTYLDPFAGQGVQAQVAGLAGVNYYGMDLTEAYVDYTNAVLPKLDIDPDVHVEVRRGDSRDPSWVPDGIGDFCFTSPPYWDAEFYSDDAEQLGTGQTYDQFMDGMTEVYAAWHPKFRPGAYVVINVNDLRRHGEFIPYHADTITAMRAAGYRVQDIWIIEGLIAGLPRAFAVSKNLARIAPKVHEYGLVFQA